MSLFSLVRFGRVERCIRTFRISRNPPCAGELLIVIRTIPIVGPLPHIPGHIVKAVSVGRKSPRAGDADVLVFPSVLERKLALKRVGHPLAVRSEFIAPAKRLAGQTAPRSEFPFGLRGQSLASPFRISPCRWIRNLHNRISDVPTGRISLPRCEESGTFDSGETRRCVAEA